MNARHIGYLILAVFAVSISAILVRLTHTSGLVTAFYRQAFSAAMLLPFFQVSPHNPLSWRQRSLLVFSGLFLALHFATWITGLAYTTVARATLFVDLQPIWASLLGAIFLGESLTGIEIAGVVAVTLGGILTVGPHLAFDSKSLRGDILAVIGGITGAGYFLIGRKVRYQLSWLHYMFSVYLYSALWLLLFNFVLFRQFPLPLQNDIGWIILMALIPSLVGHGMLNVVIRKIKAYVVNSALLGEPVLATLFAYFLFQEMPDMYYYAGAALIFAGLLIIFLKQR